MIERTAIEAIGCRQSGGGYSDDADGPRAKRSACCRLTARIAGSPSHRLTGVPDAQSERV
jgi:hypothetical protein